ncbi:hypothetical protein Aperf_G00000113613 [Anoplocephala perfoliata]
MSTFLLCGFFATSNQLLHTTLYGFFLSRSFGYLSITEIYDEVKSNIRSFIILGFLNATTIALFHFGLSLLSAAYIHTSNFVIYNAQQIVKTSVPLFVVLFSRFIGKQYSYKTYLALLTIVAGVAITSKTEVTFTFSGLIVGLLSTMGSAAFSVYMKMVLNSSNFHSYNVLFVVSGTSLVWILPIWVLVDLQGLMLVDEGLLFSQIKRAGYIFILDGIARCSQNLIAIIVLSRLSALGYSVASVVKRLFVILTAIIFFATPASPLTFFGLGLALTGLLWYNLIKEQKQTPLPSNSEESELEFPDVLKSIRIDPMSRHSSPIRNLA